LQEKIETMSKGCLHQQARNISRLRKYQKTHVPPTPNDHVEYIGPFSIPSDEDESEMELSFLLDSDKQVVGLDSA
jgi:hypothetical protein